ncbi:DUF2382 domain-containing protein [Tessaracoccus antarcticus]|uniref:DUF2382 domain-containing protein n=1 Tax=Tessaracoccus antarcticus TaxID=2479848 RepID=A0A3M0FXM9_9ACTN|nr:PRC and DUF2382 domain-containing protein [Tessaracoccus antarcticus]RMB57265.1 DUF2382 domain-containing protein [Tessaracoccus antarcticus]
MISATDIDRLLNGKATVYDQNDEKVGSLSQIYLDDTTGEPSWATVNTGLFGMSESFVPLEGADARGDDLRVGYTKDQIKDAPNLDEDHHLEAADEDRLYEYYAMQGSGRAQATNTTREHEHEHTRDHSPEVGQTHPGAADEDSLTLSEERLNVGTQTQESGRVRLRKYVVTENVTKTVPVQHEEVRIERVPVGEERSGRIDEDGGEVEVTLHEEKAVVDKDTVAVEEVRLGKETVTEQETVSADVRKERLDTDDDDGHRNR